MKLDGLKLIYKGIKAQGIERYRFRYQYNKVTFEVFFFIDETPFKLLFGVLGGSFAFELIVERGFRINPELPKQKYYELCEVLGLSYDPNNRFRTTAFFQEFNRKLPKIVHKRQEAQAHQIARYYRNVEEADKIYFFGWLNNDICGKKVSLKNLEKTKLLLGFKVYEICKAKNMSSKWTDIPSNAVKFSYPN